MITLITGPGQHADMLIEEYLKQGNKFQYFRYWPDCKRFIYQNGKLIKEERYLWYDITRKILWGTFNRLNMLNGNKRHVDILFSIYDLLISTKLRDTKKLIAWPQVSLFSIKKAKKHAVEVVLEYPMIHVNSWMRIMLDEYDKWGIPKKNATNIFSPYMVRRINHEITLSDKIVVLSSFARQTFIDNSINSSKLLNRQLSNNPYLNYPAQKSNAKKKIILYVGRIDLLKGVQYLLLAYSRLRSKNTELWVVGTKSDEISYFLPEYSDPSIKLVGVLSKTELKDVYGRASVLVLPSIQESYGLVLIEALEHKIPIIASKNTGAPDIKKLYPQTTMIIYNPENVDDLQANLSKLLNL